MALQIALATLSLAIGCGEEAEHISAAHRRPTAATIAPPPPAPSGGGGGFGGGGEGEGDLAQGWAAAARAAGHGGGLGSRIFARDEARREARVGPERLDGHDHEHEEAAWLHAALTSTTAIVDADADECEQQYERLRAGLDAFRAEREDDGASRHAPPSIASARAEYLRSCRARPADERRCLDPHYRSEHVSECQRLSDARARDGEALARHARSGDLGALQSAAGPVAREPEPPRRHHDDLLPELLE